MVKLLPTVPGQPEGVVEVSPGAVQCQQCGRIDNPETLRIVHDNGRMFDGTPALAVVVQSSSIRFHTPAWPDGTNPRLCRPCRVAKGCRCESCWFERNT